MIVVPVIDLRGGLVVRARGGRRDSYRPIETPLARSSDPIDVVSGILSLFGFSNLYVADLDAIQRRGNNSAVLAELKATFPDLRLWIDSGAASADALDAIIRAGLGVAIVGSESQRDASLLRAYKGSDDIALSLDFQGDSLEGPAELLAEPHLWPDRVIVMSLARVGGFGGPDVRRIASILAEAGGREVFAAGGVRGPGDLAMLAKSGVAGALVASALHDGLLGRADLKAI